MIRMAAVENPAAHQMAIEATLATFKTICSFQSDSFAQIQAAKFSVQATQNGKCSA